jgi:hypothetical protein
MNIAEIILHQIYTIDRQALKAYGAHHFQEIPKSDEFEGGVRFSVKGLFLQGDVLIFLTWLDDYTIVFLNQDGTKIKEYINVYCDMLVDVLDYIELGEV